MELIIPSIPSWYLTMSLGIFEVGINPRQMSELTLPNCQNGHCIYL